MCGRYTLSAGHEALAKAFLAEFGKELKASWKPRYNIAPGTGIPAILEDRDKGGRKAEVLHWGLVPHWAKDPNIGYKMINARAETIAEKPAYRDAFRYRRCLVPASGFYEWDRRGTPRQPYYFYPQEGEFMALAAIWEHWLHPSGSEILSVALITKPADPVVGRIHHRMPVILPETVWEGWLDTGLVKPSMTGFLDRLPSHSILRSHPVSLKVNKTDSDTAALVEPVSSVSPEAEESSASGQLDLFDDPGT
jgi:putative SOS response-associated peptidase YedK